MKKVDLVTMCPKCNEQVRITIDEKQAKIISKAFKAATPAQANKILEKACR
jgi:hypothetical protein